MLSASHDSRSYPDSKYFSRHTTSKKRGRSPSVERNNRHKQERNRLHVGTGIDEGKPWFKKEDTFNRFRRESQFSEDVINRKNERNHDLNYRKAQWGLSNDSRNIEVNNQQMPNPRQQIGRLEQRREMVYSTGERSGDDRSPINNNDRSEFPFGAYGRRTTKLCFRSREDSENVFDRRNHITNTQRGIGKGNGYNATERYASNHVDFTSSSGNSSFLRYQERARLRQVVTSSCSDRNRISCWDSDIRIEEKFRSPQDQSSMNFDRKIIHNEEKCCGRQSPSLDACREKTHEQNVEGCGHSTVTGYDRCEHFSSDEHDLCEIRRNAESCKRLLKLNSFNEEEYIRPPPANLDVEDGELDESVVTDNLTGETNCTDESANKIHLTNLTAVNVNTHTLLESNYRIEQSPLMAKSSCISTKNNSRTTHDDPVPPFVTSPDHADNGSNCAETDAAKCRESMQRSTPTESDCSVVVIDEILDKSRRTGSSSTRPPSVVEVELTSETAMKCFERENIGYVCLSTTLRENTSAKDKNSFNKQIIDDDANSCRLMSKKGSKKWRAIQAGREMSSNLSLTCDSTINITPKVAVAPKSIYSNNSKQSTRTNENIRSSQCVGDRIQVSTVEQEGTTSTVQKLGSNSKSECSHKEIVIDERDMPSNTNRYPSSQENTSGRGRQVRVQKSQVLDSRLLQIEYHAYSKQCKMQASTDCNDTSLVSPGCQVAIDRDGNGEYKTGIVTKLLPGKKRGFRVKYDEDGEKEWVNLNVTPFRLTSNFGPQSTCIQKTRLPDKPYKLQEGNSMRHPGLQNDEQSVIAKRSEEQETSLKPSISYLDRFKYKSNVEKLKERTKINNRAFATLAKLNDKGEKKKVVALDKVRNHEGQLGVFVSSAKVKDEVREKRNKVVKLKLNNLTNASTREWNPLPALQEDWVTSGSKSYSSDSDTDDDEVMEWGSKLFGVPVQKRGRDADKGLKCLSLVQRPKVFNENDEEQKKRKEEARSLTTAEIRAILGEDVGGDHGDIASHWVRRSSRQPCKSALKAPKLLLLLAKLRNNDSDMVVLKMKKYCPDSATPSIVVDTVLDALEENTNCEALYIQNFNLGMRDEQVLHLLKILQRPSCKIWCLNIGETYNVQTETWEEFAYGLKTTKVTHMYASEHTISTELKDEIRETIRVNRSKHTMHIDPSNLDTIIRCTHCWWNPSNATVLKPYIKNIGYDSILLDADAQGLLGSNSEGRYLI